MMVPRPMPEEWVRGYLDRFQRLESTPDLMALRTRMRESLAGSATPLQGLRMLALLALITEMPRDVLVVRHTLIPFHLAVWPPTGRGSPDFSARTFDDIGGIASKTTWLGSHFLCPECAAEDESFWGFSYWRRTHQIPGIVVCDKHHAGLREVKNHICAMPAEMVDDSKAIDNAVVDDALRNPTISRYASICSSLAELQVPLEATTMAHVIARRLAQFVGSAAQARRVLRDITNQQAGGPWLRRHFPEACPQLNRDQSVELQRTMSAHTPPHTGWYGLALAVLFESTEAAMAALHNAPRGQDARAWYKQYVGTDNRVKSASFRTRALQQA